MQTVDKRLLEIDAAVNLALGILLLLFPAGIVNLLGLPPTDTHFYTGILGAVLFGIGIALLIERYGEAKRIRGLGLEGAIAINFCGAGVLFLWLLLVPFDIPLRGKLILWSIAIGVIAIGVIELFTRRAGKR